MATALFKWLNGDGEQDSSEDGDGETIWESDGGVWKAAMTQRPQQRRDNNSMSNDNDDGGSSGSGSSDFGDDDDDSSNNERTLSILCNELVHKA